MKKEILPNGEIYASDFRQFECDKCGLDTTPNNSVYRLNIELGSGIMATDRHIFPTESCEGSPSRASLILGTYRTGDKDKELSDRYKLTWLELNFKYHDDNPFP